VLYDGPLLCGFYVAIKGLNLAWQLASIRRSTAAAAAVVYMSDVLNTH